MSNNKALSPTMRFIPFLIIMIMISGCGTDNKNQAEHADTVSAAEKKPFIVTSSAFEPNGRIDLKYTRGDRNISIPLAWENAPEGTKSFAVFMVDLHEIAGLWAHWVVTNIPADANALPEGASGTDQLPKGSKEHKNTSGQLGYFGPLPPKGSGDHEYQFIVYALDTDAIEFPEAPGYKLFEKLVEGHVLATAQISGFYENK